MYKHSFQQTAIYIALLVVLILALLCAITALTLYFYTGAYFKLAGTYFACYFIASVVIGMLSIVALRQ